MAALPPPPRKNNSPLFADAPSQYLAFAQGEPITAAEIVAFSPNGLRSFAITFRFASNGYSNQIIEEMVDYFRTPSSKGKADKNSICKMMQKSVRDKKLFTYPGTKVVKKQRVAAMLEWTNNYHQKANLKDTYGPFNHTNLELTGESPDLGKNGVLVPDVRFDSLAIGVQRFPSHRLGDGLNLSSCVQYAVAHPQENWMYPSDFTALVNHMGRRTIQQKHLDQEVFRRWKSGPPSPAAAPIKAPLLAHGFSAPAAQSTGQVVGAVPVTQAAALPAAQPPQPVPIAPLAPVVQTHQPTATAQDPQLVGAHAPNPSGARPVPSHFVAPFPHPAARGGLHRAMKSNHSTRSVALRPASSGVSKSRKSQRKKMLWSNAHEVQFLLMQNTIDVRAQIGSHDQSSQVLDPVFKAISNPRHSQHPVLVHGNDQQISYKSPYPQFAHPEPPSKQLFVPVLSHGNDQQASYTSQYRQFSHPEPSSNQHYHLGVPQNNQLSVFEDTIMDGMDLDPWDPELLCAAKTPTAEEINRFFDSVENVENAATMAPLVPSDTSPHHATDSTTAFSMFPDLPPIISEDPVGSIYDPEGQPQESLGTVSPQNLPYPEIDDNGLVPPNGFGPYYRLADHQRHDSWY
ncbi:hypothetical protein HBI61_175010 [Parastagonospora nodorum]|nr:hypothetical protein HBI61_175010 [Parastagonospora nodorum]